MIHHHQQKFQYINLHFNLAPDHIYDLQLWVCTSRHSNLYKVEQVETHVLRDIIYVGRHVGQELTMSNTLVEGNLGSVWTR